MANANAPLKCMLVLTTYIDHGNGADWLMEECDGSELYHGRVQCK